MGGERLQDRLNVLNLSRGLACDQVGPCHAGCRVDTVRGGGGQSGKHVPGGGLLRRGESVVGALCAVGDGAFDAAGSFVVGEGEGVSGAVSPGLVECV